MLGREGLGRVDGLEMLGREGLGRVDGREMLGRDEGRDMLGLAEGLLIEGVRPMDGLARDIPPPRPPPPRENPRPSASSEVQQAVSSTMSGIANECFIMSLSIGFIVLEKFAVS